MTDESEVEYGPSLDASVIIARNSDQARVNIATEWSTAACWVAFWGFCAFAAWVI